MLTFSNCKINLGLFITDRRADGFHNLASVFYPIEWNDAIEIELNPSSKAKIDLIEYGNSVTKNASENLCVKAYNLLDTKFNLPSIKLHLFKTIPTGAGLGGGSANASNTLKLLNSFFDLKISIEELKNYASQLGSDCAFFIDNTPAFVTRRGENIKPINLNLSHYSILLIKPAVHISTTDAFSKITSTPIDFDLEKAILLNPINEWKNFLRNDFEKGAILNNPIIGEIKNAMYQWGALFASMSGSGSSVFGIFDAYEKAEQVAKKYGDLKQKLIYSTLYLKNFI